MVLQWYLWYMVIYVIRYVDTYFDINWYIFIYAYISYQINILPTSTNDRPTNPLVCGMFSTGFHSNARPGHCWRVMRYGSWQNGLLETETQRRTTARGGTWNLLKKHQTHGDTYNRVDMKMDEHGWTIFQFQHICQMIFRSSYFKHLRSAVLHNRGWLRLLARAAWEKGEASRMGCLGCWDIVNRRNTHK